MRLFLTVCASVILAISARAQSTVSGTITDSQDGSGIPGVNVVVTGTSKGTTTDVNGQYSLQLAPGENTLSFSFVGYKTQVISVEGRTTIDISLEQEFTTLEELVVVGYGVQKKSDVTGSVANVKGDELVKQPVMTATQALQGKVAGVQIISSGQPGTSPQVRIRGVGTAFAGTTALYVVDGVLTDDITNINTADIVDINILKDASAAAIYGSRGANGVIIITTRKGKSSGIRVDYNNNIGIRQAANLVDMANSAEYSNYAQAASGTIPPSTDYSTDWYDVILRNAWQQSHNLSLSTGNEKSSYLFNAGYLTDQGVVLHNDFKRLTFRLNGDYKISDKVSAGVQSSYANGINQNGFNNIDVDIYGNIGAVYNDAYRAAPIIPSKVDGLYGNTSAYGNVGNPLLDIENNDINVKENRLQGSAYLEYKPITWLSLRSAIGADWKNSLNRAYNYKFDANDGETFLTPGGNQLVARSKLNVKQTQTSRWVWDNTATITRSFGDHNINFLAGITAEEYNQHWFSALRNDVPEDPDLWYINVGDANSSQNDGKGDKWTRTSYLARVNYSFQEKYLLTATIRRDGSSRLPGANRWQTYPSLGLGWVLSRESFLQGQDLFDLVKLRASYGKVGNDQIPTDAYTATVEQNTAYSFNGSARPAENGVQIKRILDPNITWETTEEYDVAIEFGLLQSRLSGEVNYYNKKVENALINVPFLKTTGDFDGFVITNVASIQNKGVEVVLNWKDRINDNFSYSISGNATFNHNEVVALNGGQAIREGGIGAAQGFVTYTDNGIPVGSFYVLKTLGVFNSVAEVNAYTDADGTIIQPNAKPGDFRYQDTNDDGQIDDSDRVYAGSYQPVAYFGLDLGVNFKSWDFSMSLYGNMGNEVYNGKKAVRVDSRDNVERDVVYDRWTSANHTQNEPRANEGNLPASDYFVESGSFLRINNLTVGYTFPNAWLSKIKVANLRVFATSQNLFTLMKYSGFTAELPGNPLNSGIELSAYPTTRTIAVGLNVGF
ncbi:MAG TPA: TonB-dependent receptor [Ohtaekwangia sp.]